MDHVSAVGAEPTGEERLREGAYRKIAWRIMPFLLLCYVANYIDRVNIGIAQISLRTDLGFTDQVYGIGVGLFFVGFILFEVPSNLLLGRIGARKTLLRIMVGWGLVSAATMFVRTPAEFYTARILLGIAEAGFFPGALLYLSYWFPSARRTRITGLFFLGLPLSGIIGSPLSGWIMHSFDTAAGLHGWQWLFLIEGLPSALLGIGAFLYLKDRPQEAGWLNAAEKRAVAEDLAREQSVKTRPGHYAFLQALRDPRVYVLGLVACGTYTLANAVGFWSPLIINASGVRDVLNVGLLGTIAPVVAIVVMLLVGRHSDATLERRWHAAGAEFVGAASLVLLSVTIGKPYLTVILLAAMTAGHYAGLTVFFSIPSIYLSDRAAAGGIAMVTAMGSVAAALTPALLGWIKTTTGSLALGMQISACIVAMGGIVLLAGIPSRLLREGR
jgi:D-galactonate transporter